MNIFSYIVKVNATLRPCSILGVADYFFESMESLDSTDAAQALAASAFGQSWATCPDFLQ